MHNQFQLEHPLEIDENWEDYVQALYELRDKYLAERAAERASGITRVRRGGGRRRGTTTRTRTSTTTETVTVNTDGMVTSPPPGESVQQLALKQLNGNSPRESEVKLFHFHANPNLLSVSLFFLPIVVRCTYKYIMGH